MHLGFITVIAIPSFFFRFFFNFVILNIYIKNILLTNQFYFAVMSELSSVYRLEITVPAGWALNTNN